MTFTEKKKKVKQRWKRRRWRRKNSQWFMFGAVVVAWFSCWILVTNLIDGSTGQGWATRGQFGDMFGAVNALFSGLAFGGIIITILLQKQELRLQRKELSLTRQELQETRKEFEQQNETLWLQRFETTLFNLLSSHHKLLDTIKYKENRLTTYEGREVITKVVETMKRRLHEIEIKEEIIKQLTIDEFRKEYKVCIKAYEDQLQLYLESVYTILKYISSSDLLIDSERNYYFDIVLSQLSISEKTFIYYHLSIHDPEATNINLSFGFHEVERKHNLFRHSENILFHASHTKLVDYWKHFKITKLIKLP